MSRAHKRATRPDDPWMSIPQAARCLGVANTTVYAMVTRGELAHAIVATRTVVTRESVHALKAEREEASRVGA